MITDVIALPGSGHLLAAAGWRGGEPTNGLYESSDAGASFTRAVPSSGWVPASQQGRVTLARSADGKTLVAVVQDTSVFVKPNASGTILAGVFESTSGPSGAWNRIASSGQLSASGSAQARSGMRGYKPGVQAWYNQFLAIDPANVNHIYLGLEEVYETTNGGANWEIISGDLTRNDKSKQGPSGGPITKDNTSIEYYDVIFTMTESPLKKGLLWVGTDDGLVHVTQDGGKHWENVTPKGMPEWIQVNSIEASPFDPATAYFAATMYQFDDFRPYLYKTTDYGKSWVQINNGIPANMANSLVVESRWRASRK